MEMTPRENMTAILEGRQPAYYGDFQSAVKVMLDPVWAKRLHTGGRPGAHGLVGDGVREAS